MPERQFPRRFGKYLLMDQLAVGGMAEVFLAKVRGAEKFERLIAIKCMRPELATDDEFASMFIDEANVAGQLNHANIVQIYELGRFKNQLYIAMELIEGRDLRSVLERSAEENKPIPIPFAAYCIWSAAQALDYAHRAVTPDGRPLNLVHRDISPPNLLVSWEGEVKVVDFGIAKATARGSETRVGVLKGKFAYMAPEQVAGLEMDRRADIFTLGTVLYELLTGTKLFAAETEFEVLERVKNVIIPDLRQKLPDAPQELLTALYNCLAKEPEKRFQFASEVAKALAPLLIIDRTIFGTAEASAFLNDLYSRDTDRAARQAQRNLAELSPTDHGAPGDDSSWRRNTQTFRSSFDLSDSAIRAATEALGEPGGEQDDLWHVQTSELGIRPLDLAPKGSGDTKPPVASAAPSLSEQIQRATGDYTSLAGLQPRGGIVGWLLVGSLFALAAGLGFLWYQQEGDAVAEDAAAADADDADDGEEVAADDSETGAEEDDGRSDFGFVSIRLKGSKTGTVYVDGKRVGRAPGVVKVRTGSRLIKVEHPKMKGRSRSKRITVTKKNNRKAPVTVMLQL